MGYGTAPHKDATGHWVTYTGRRLNPAGQAYWEDHHRKGLVTADGHVTHPALVHPTGPAISAPQRRREGTPTRNGRPLPGYGAKVAPVRSELPPPPFHPLLSVIPPPPSKRDTGPTLSQWKRMTPEEKMNYKVPVRGGRAPIGFQGATYVDNRAREELHKIAMQTAARKLAQGPSQPSQLEFARAYATMNGQADFPEEVAKVKAYNEFHSHDPNMLSSIAKSTAIWGLHGLEAAASSVGVTGPGATGQVVAPHPQASADFLTQETFPKTWEALRGGKVHPWWILAEVAPWVLPGALKGIKLGTGRIAAGTAWDNVIDAHLASDPDLARIQAEAPKAGISPQETTDMVQILKEQKRALMRSLVRRGESPEQFYDRIKDVHVTAKPEDALPEIAMLYQKKPPAAPPPMPETLDFKAMAQRLLQTQKMPPELRTIPALAKRLEYVYSLIQEGAPYKDWYERFANVVGDAADRLGVDRATFSKVMGITSQQSDPSENLRRAILAVLDYQKTGKVSGLIPDEFKPLWTGDKYLVDTESQAPKLDTVLSGGDIVHSGKDAQKTINFDRNILEDLQPDQYKQQYGDQHFTTVDRWATESVSPKLGKNPGTYYDAIASIYEDFAQQLGWKPKEAQAAAWVPEKANSLAATDAKRGWDVTRERNIEKSKDAGERTQGFYRGPEATKGTLYQGAPDFLPEDFGPQNLDAFHQSLGEDIRRGVEEMKANIQRAGHRYNPGDLVRMNSGRTMRIDSVGWDTKKGAITYGTTDVDTGIKYGGGIPEDGILGLDTREEGTTLYQGVNRGGGEHPRNAGDIARENGAWTSATPELAPEVQSAVEALKEPDGGFTLHPEDFSPDTGDTYIVARKGFERILPVDEVTPEVLTAYRNSVMPFIKDDPSARIGGWHDPESGKVYLDVSQEFADRSEAMAFGREHEQKAIFNRKTFESEPVEPSGKAIRSTLDEPTQWESGVGQAYTEADLVGEHIMGIPKDGESTLLSKAPYRKAEWRTNPEYIRGYTKFQADEAIIGLVKGKADIATLGHEIMHVIRRFGLLAEQEGKFAKAFGATEIKGAEGEVVGYEWSRQAEEKAARGFESWLRTGRGPEPVRYAVERLAPRFREIYSEGELPELSRAERKLYDNLFKTQRGKGPLLGLGEPLLAQEEANTAGRVDIPLDPENPPAEQQIMDSLQAAEEVYARNADVRSEVRAERLKAAHEAYARAGGGLEGHEAFMAELRGPLPSEDFTAIQHFTDDTIDRLLDNVQNSPVLDSWEKLQLRVGIVRMHQGMVPRPFEVILLRRAYGTKAMEQVVSKHSGLLHWVYQIGNLPRSIMASADVSAPFRQGLIAMFHDPVAFARNLGPMFHYLVSEKGYREAMDAMEADPRWESAIRDGVPMTDLGDELHSEEAFASNLAETLTGLGPLFGKKKGSLSFVRASGRAYTGFLNKLRFDLYNSLIEDMSKEYDGVITRQQRKDIAKFVGWATGRGKMPAKVLEDSAPFFNTVFFSPRLFASRIQTLDPFFYASLDPLLQKKALLATGKMVAFGSGILSLAWLLGAKVELDPRSSDWGKIRIGNLRVDIWGGHQQLARTIAQIGSGHIKDSNGVVQSLYSRKFGAKTSFDVLQTFLMGKEAPLASLGTDFLKNSNFQGQPFNIKQELIDRSIPLIGQDAYKVLTDTGSPYGALGTYLVGATGIGMQDYPPREEQKSKDNIGKLEQKAKETGYFKAPDAVKKDALWVARLDALTANASTPYERFVAAAKLVDKRYGTHYSKVKPPTQGLAEDFYLQLKQQLAPAYALYKREIDSRERARQTDLPVGSK